LCTQCRYYSKLAPANQPNGLILPSHVLPASLFTLSGGEGEQSSLITILSIWNTMMGSSVLAMPWAIDQAGFSLGIVAMVLMCGLALYTCLIVLDAGGGGRCKCAPPAFIRMGVGFIVADGL
jgi:sodium-coupled neutral amino acid transporter 9